jgi:hypothetical protein
MIKMYITCPKCENLSRAEQARCQHITIDASKIPANKLRAISRAILPAIREHYYPELVDERPAAPARK